MADTLLYILTLVTVLGCGLVAGTFFAFSTFVMRALARLPSAQGITAMQSINIAVITPSFMVAMFGTALCCIALTAIALLTWNEPGRWYLLSGSLLYLIGTVLVTIVANVPRNNVLAHVEPHSTEAATAWRRYLTEWTAWNHGRTAAAASATVLLAIALVAEN